jgi:ABC-type polysaccharide/polyol phosphate export permease
VNPSNTKERIFVIVVMMVGVVSFSFIAGSLTTLVQDYDTILSENK